MIILNAVDCLSSGSIATLSGSFSGFTLTLTSQAMNGEVITLNLADTGNFNSGTYTVTGGSSDCDDKGTVTARPIPPITGSWVGVLRSPDGVSENVSITASLTQAPFAVGGYSPLSGSVTLDYSSPLPVSTVTLPILTSGASISAVTGGYVDIFTNTFTFHGEIVDPATATELTGVSTGASRFALLTLTKLP
jgi:hypothetical protein